MKRAAYTKPNSAVRKDAAILRNVVSETLRIAGITAEMRNAVMFETGCALVEKYVPDERFRKHTLQNSAFWNWWVVEFTRDDDILLCQPTPGMTDELHAMARKDYKQFKMMMIDDEQVQQGFRYMPEGETVDDIFESK